MFVMVCSILFHFSVQCRSAVLLSSPFSGALVQGAHQQQPQAPRRPAALVAVFEAAEANAGDGMGILEPGFEGQKPLANLGIWSLQKMISMSSFKLSIILTIDVYK